MGTGVTGILLDTHVLLWWLGDRKRLTSAAFSAIEDPAHKAYVSAVSAWEMTIKQRLGKLNAGPILTDFERLLEEEGFTPLHITVGHALNVGSEKSANKDPFDQLLAAQARLENLSIVSSDRFFDKQAIQRIW
jgi:PIN domain nuclease of toxin-antitoxin system